MVMMISVILLSIRAQEEEATVKIFAIQDVSFEAAKTICDKFNRQLRNIMSDYPEYANTSNTNVLWTPLNGMQATLRWGGMQLWTNAAGTTAIYWWPSLPNETNGIPFKEIIFNAITKDKIQSYMESNNCVIVSLPTTHKIITDSIVVYQYGQ